MIRLHMMNREFEGRSWAVSEMLEDSSFRDSLVFEDSWYFLHYCFFGRDWVCSEDTDTLRTHLYNLAAALFTNFESHTESAMSAGELRLIICELVEICEYVVDYPVCIWTYGDDSSRELLSDCLVTLPDVEKMRSIHNAPACSEASKDRLPYRYSEPKAALKRFRREEAAYNRRKKIAGRKKIKKAEQDVPAKSDRSGG